MTEHDTQTIPAGQQPHREPRRSRRLLTVVGAAALFLAGTGAGVAVGSPAPAHAPVVSPTVRWYAPQACLDALDKAEAMLGHARTGFGYAAELMGISGEGFEAGYRSDADAMDEAAGRMGDVNEKISILAPKMSAAVAEYNAAAAECRLAA